MTRHVEEHARTSKSIAAKVASASQGRTRANPARLTGARRPIRDPHDMSPKERLAELGGLLSRGYRRLLVSRETGLAEAGDTERRCGSVDRSETMSPKEGQS